MALSYTTAVRNAKLDAITTQAGTLVKIRFYTATRATNANTALGAQTLLAELIGNATFAPASSGAVLTLNAITGANATATGTTTWFRMLKTDGTTVIMDGDVAASASDLNMTSTAFVSGQPVAISSFVITEGNP